MKKILLISAALFLTGLACAVSGSSASLPDGFSTVKLGMSVDSVKDALKKDSQFGFRGDRDVSLAPVTKETIIETDSRYAPWSFLERCWFQFEEEKLYVITINIDQKKLDHYSVFSSLCKKYGNPDEISPQKAVWQNDSVIMSLERPLTLKYIDAQAFKKKMDKASVDKTYAEKSAEEFLGGL